MKADSDAPTQAPNVAIGAAICAASVAAAAAGLIIGSDERSTPLVVLCCLGLLWTVAAAIVTVRTRCPLSHVVQAFALVVSVGGLAWSLQRDHHRAGVAALSIDLALRLAAALSAALFLHLVMSMPDGRFVRPGDRRVALTAYVVCVAVGLLLMFHRQSVIVWPVVVLWVATLAAVPVAHARYRSAGVVEQRRMQWLGWSVVVAVEISLLAGALTILADWPHHTTEIILGSSGLLALALVAGTVPRMLSRVDRLLTGTVSAAGLTALVVVAYLLALAAFGRKPNGSERSLLLLSMVAAAGSAIAYQPTRAWLTDRANRVVYGERLSPDEALRTWGSRLTRAIPMDELLLQLAETLRKSMQLQSAQVWTGADGRFEIAAMVPLRERGAFHVGEKERAVVSRAGVSGGTWLDVWLPGLVAPAATKSTRVAPIAHNGELLGLIVCERPADRAPFTDEDDVVLTELSRQVGLALHNVQLDTALQASLDDLRNVNEELRASRVRIVAAGDAERRKLERNLHDGAQQHLVSLAVKLRLARDAVVDDPADAETMIDEIRGDLQEAITELRALAHGIFPPLLMSGGLAEALPAAASRAALPTRSKVDVGRHPSELEAAVYFCCLEALQNAGKHAGPAAEASVTVWEADDRLWWSVEDTGPGFDPSQQVLKGHGFVNMTDRMGSFGGDLEVISAPGAGTTLRGSIPLTPSV